MSTSPLSRRAFLGIAAAALWSGEEDVARAAALRGASVPVGLELYSVRGELATDLLGTVAAVGKMGYQVVEFYAPYLDWTSDMAKSVRKVLDDSGLVCHSTHNNDPSFTPADNGTYTVTLTVTDKDGGSVGRSLDRASGC